MIPIEGSSRSISIRKKAKEHATGEGMAGKETLIFLDQSDALKSFISSPLVHTKEVTKIYNYITTNIRP